MSASFTPTQAMPARPSAAGETGHTAHHQGLYDALDEVRAGLTRGLADVNTDLNAKTGAVASVAGKTGAVSLVRADVGLSQVDNTSDTAKPVSTATQAALDAKAPLASPTFTGTVAGVTKTHVGLGNVDNTGDLAKPISTATQAALNAKGTSNLTIGTTSTTAKAGDYAPTAASITDSTVTGRGVVTAVDPAAARTAIGAYAKPAGGIPAADLSTTYVAAPSAAGASGQVLTVQSDGTLAWSAASSRQVIEHGSVAATIRPVTSGPVTWIGTVQPSNWVDGDDWFQAAAVVTDIPTTNLVNYWRAEDLGLTAGQAVTTMANRVSGGPALTASGGPVFNVESSVSNVLLDGVDDQLSETTTTLNQPTTVVSVGRFVATAASKPWVSSASTVQAITVTSGSKWSANGGTSLAHTASIDTGWHMVAAVFNGASTTIYVDGVAVTGAGGANTRAGNRIGTNSGATAFTNMKVAMVAEYSTALAGTDLDAIRTALKNRYAVLP